MDKIDKYVTKLLTKENMSIKISQELNETNVFDRNINDYHKPPYECLTNVYFGTTIVTRAIFRSLMDSLPITSKDDRTCLFNSDPEYYANSSYGTHRRKYYSHKVTIKES